MDHGVGKQYQRRQYRYIVERRYCNRRRPRMAGRSRYHVYDTIGHCVHPAGRPRLRAGECYLDLRRHVSTQLRWARVWYSAIRYIRSEHGESGPLHRDMCRGHNGAVVDYHQHSRATPVRWQLRRGIGRGLHHRDYSRTDEFAFLCTDYSTDRSHVRTDQSTDEFTFFCT